MTVHIQVDSQSVTGQYMWYISMCCINNSISCLEKRQHLEHMSIHTMSSSMLVCLPPLLVSLKFTRPELIGRPTVALVLQGWPANFLSTVVDGLKRLFI